MAPARRWSLSATQIAPLAALVAGLLPIINDRVIYPLLLPLAAQDRSLIPLFQVLDSAILATFSIALLPVALELARLAPPGRLRDIGQILGGSAATVRAALWLLVALTVSGLPASLRPLDQVLRIAVGAWWVVASSAFRGSGAIPIRLAGLGMMAGGAEVLRELGVEIAFVVLIADVGWVVFFVWLASFLYRSRANKTSAVAMATP